jgi:hypothetical protein
MRIASHGKACDGNRTTPSRSRALINSLDRALGHPRWSVAYYQQPEHTGATTEVAGAAPGLRPCLTRQ